MSTRRILIIGGSTRAAADSVRRAGWQPVCADFFADLDLQSTAEIVPVQSYPHSLPDDVADVRADAWFYCGALENHSEIIEQILVKNSSLGPLLGSSPQALKLVRNPHWLKRTLEWEGVATLEVAHASSPPEPDGSWLQKPLSSAGGRLIRVWDAAATRIPFGEKHYFQARASGFGMSAIFRIQDRDAEWLGASRELDAPLTSSPPTRFSYCGSCGPLMKGECNIAGHQNMDVISSSVQQKLTTVARILARQTKGLNGLIGLDFRLDGDAIWLTEVNPRYTASVEILELADSRSLLILGSSGDIKGHVKEISRPASQAEIPRVESKSIVVKQILYASSPISAPDLSHWMSDNDPWQIPILADIPPSGMRIETGWPICTVMASGPNPESALREMERRLTYVRDALRM